MAENKEDREKAARAEEKMAETMEKWLPEDWRKPIFLRRRAGAKNIFWRVFWGLFFLVAALAVAGSIFGFINFTIGIWWLILIIFLIAIIIASLVNLNWFGVFVPAAGILTILNYQNNQIQYLDNWAWLNFNGQEIAGIFGVAILLTIAFSILFHKKSYREIRAYWRDHDDNFANSFSNRGEIATENDGREVAVRAHLGEAVRYIESKNLERVMIDCVMGAVKIYFNNAELANNELAVLVNCSLGGVEMYVPRDWKIVIGLNASFGGVEEKGRPELREDSPVVRLGGNANLGGVQIIYI